MNLLLFIFGSAIGSFLNVVSLRYDPDKFLLGKQITGRSHCPNCSAKLAWYDLLPVFSFIFLRGRCRHCHARISFQYPLVEIISGFIFVLIPMVVASPYLQPYANISFSASWILIFEILLLLSLIDLRFGIIPDEANILLVALGIAVTFLVAKFWEPTQSFIGPYGMILGFGGGIWLNHFFGGFVGFLLLGLLIVITRGRGMGVGDLKLIFPLGLIFGWPEIIFVLAASFIIGSVASIFIIFSRKKTMKSSVPFGPFIALGAATTFFFGEEILRFYFGLFPLG